MSLILYFISLVFPHENLSPLGIKIQNTVKCNKSYSTILFLTDRCFHMRLEFNLFWEKKHKRDILFLIITEKKKLDNYFDHYILRFFNSNSLEVSYLNNPSYREK